MDTLTLDVAFMLLLEAREILTSSAVECAAERGDLRQHGIADYDALKCLLKSIDILTGDSQ